MPNAEDAVLLSSFSATLALGNSPNIAVALP
jgi:hypothetical protein